MISKKYIKELEFNTIEDIYNYIVDSEINGAYSQVRELINKLSTSQFKDFCDWYENILPQPRPLNWFIQQRGLTKWKQHT